MSHIDRILNAFKDSRFIPKVGIVFGLYFIIALSSWLISFLSFVIPVWAGIMEEIWYYRTSMIDFSTLFLLFSIFVLPILMIPINIYLRGYGFRIADRMRKGESPSLSEHSNMSETFKLGLVNLSVAFLMNVPVIILFIGAIYCAAILPSILGGSIALSLTICLICIFFFMFLLLLLIVVINIFFLPAFMFLYLRERSFTEAFSPDQMWEIIQLAWKEFILLWLLIILVKISTAFVAFFLCCLGPLINPFIQTLSLLLTAAVTGSIYYSIQQRILRE